MKTLRIIKTGKIVEVENGIAHGMIDRGEAELFRSKEMEKPPKDKMVSKGRTKLRTK